jgi:hypothetical protein
MIPLILFACVETPTPTPAITPVAARFTNGYVIEEMQTQHKRAWGTDIPQGKSVVITHCFQEMKTTIKSGYGKTARETPVYGDLCDYDEDVFVPVNQIVLQGTGVSGIDEFPVAPSPDGNQRIKQFSKYTIIFSDKSVIHPDKAEYIRQAGKL